MTLSGTAPSGSSVTLGMPSVRVVTAHREAAQIVACVFSYSHNYMNVSFFSNGTQHHRLKIKATRNTSSELLIGSMNFIIELSVTQSMCKILRTKARNGGVACCESDATLMASAKDMVFLFSR